MSSPTGERQAEVFPWMEHAVVAGGVIGAVTAVLVGLSLELGAGGLVLAGLFGSLAGDLVGVCVALYWAITVPADRTTVRDLWDPWLDAQNPPGEREVDVAFPVQEPVETPGEIMHWRARVRPRVLSSETGEALPLTDFVGPILAGGGSGAIRIQGPPGSGKTTALEHLAGVVPPHLSVSFLDEPHRPVQLLLAADWLARAIKDRAEGEALAVALPRDLVLEAASRIADDSDSVDRLRSLINDCDVRIHPMVASLLHALRFGWKPNWPPPRLAGAYLEEAAWAEINLAGANMRDADLAGANLRGSRLDRANLEDANLIGAHLDGSSMPGAALNKADLSRASLPHVYAERSRFESARLVGASLIRAKLERAILVDADLSDTRLSGASLVGADLRSAKLEGADFSEADLSGAILKGLTLSGAQFTSTRFTGADLTRCNLEGMVLPGAVFADAELRDALLTGSHMPGADFRGARLRAAGLAEVEWEGVDLRGADLREAAFHLGSSRSGLVGSPIACEGSRTGFYTDDWSEQDFKSPEEIRKANLCGADLRGARIDDVDFYLVDLRGAHLDPEQIPHIRRCGAILEAKA